MSEVNFNGLDDIYKEKEPKAEAKHLDLSGLDDIYSPKEAPQKDEPSTAMDALTGAGDTLGISQQVAGAAQGIPDAAMAALHKFAPGLVGASPTQISSALKNMGFNGDLGPTSSAEMYKEGGKDEVKRQDEAVARSPIAYRAGEAGGLGLGALGTAGLMPEIAGAGAVAKAAPVVGKTLAKAGVAGLNAAPVGALYGGLNSKNGVIGGSLKDAGQVAKDSAIGSALALPLGAAGNLIGQGLGKATGAVKNTKVAQRIGDLFKEGTEGKDFSSRKTQVGNVSEPESLSNALSQHDTRSAQEIVESIHSADEHLGQNVGESLRNATDKGVIIRAQPNVVNQLDELAGQIPDVPINSEFSPTETKLRQKGELAVEKERLMGNQASSEVVPTTDSQGKKILNLVTKRRNPDVGEVERVVAGAPDEAAVAQQDNPELTSPADDSVQPELQQLKDASPGDSVSVQNKYDEDVPGTKVSELINKFQNEGLTPQELWNLRGRLGELAGDYNSPTNSPSDKAIGAQLTNVVSQLNGILKMNVPEFGVAADRMYQFRRNLPETLLSKDNPIDITNLRMSGTRNVSTKLLNSVKQMIRGMDTGDQTAQGAYTNFLKGLHEFNKNELQRKASGAIPQTIFDKLGQQPQDIEKHLLETAKRSSLIQSYKGMPSDTLTGKVANVASKSVDYLSNQAGIAKTGASNFIENNPVVSTSKKLYAATDDVLQNFSDKVLSKIPGQKGLSDALNKALEHKDVVAKNAVLFSIMQNPSLRSLVDSNNMELEP